jgi:hypothetical protein
MRIFILKSRDYKFKKNNMTENLKAENLMKAIRLLPQTKTYAKP